MTNRTAALKQRSTMRERLGISTADIPSAPSASSTSDRDASTRTSRGGAKQEKEKTDPREEIRLNRVYRVDHQNLFLTIDMQRRAMAGMAEIHMHCPTGTDRVFLHARQFHISSVRVDGKDAPFEYKNYLERVTPRNFPLIRDLASFNMYHKAAVDASDVGELMVDLPSDRPNEMVVISVYYELPSPIAGLRFSGEREEEGGTQSIPLHLFTYSQVNSSRLWMPCIDSLHDRCTWDIHVTTEEEMIVVASGELVEKTLTTNDGKFACTHFSLDVPSAPHSIGLAVGPFKVVPDPCVPFITHFCLPLRISRLQHVLATVHKALQFIREELGVSFPYKSYKQVFVEDDVSDMTSFASLAILDTHLLHHDDTIEQTRLTRRVLTEALTRQWFGELISANNWSDIWIVEGLSAFVTHMFMRSLHGKNQQRWDLLEMSDFVMSQGETAPPLCWHGYLHPAQVVDNPYRKAKALIVAQLMERRIGFNAFIRAIGGLLSPAPDGSLNRNLQTHAFFKMLRERGAGHDIRLLEKQWVCGVRHPSFVGAYNYNKKRAQTEFALKQVGTQWTGTITLRVHELNGSYDHAISLDGSEVVGGDFPIHSRLKKSRKRTIRYANGDEVDIDCTSRSDAVLLWMRLDPGLRWLPRRFTLHLPLYMYVNMLELDRDISAQKEAIQALANLVGKEDDSRRVLLRTVANDSAIFFPPIRGLAARAIARIASRHPSPLDMVKGLMEWYKDKYFIGDVPLPNDFGNIVEYEVKKDVAVALATVKDRNGFTPPAIIEFVTVLLANNDNDGNIYSDYTFLSRLIIAAGSMRARNKLCMAPIDSQIQRYMRFAQIKPWFHNAVLSACVKAKMLLMAQQIIDVDLTEFEQFMEMGHFIGVRANAYESLLSLSIEHERTRQLLIDLLQDPDESPKLKFMVTERLCNLIIKDSRLGDSLRCIDPINAVFVDTIWAVLNSPVCAFDPRLRLSVHRLYRTIYGLGNPLPVSARVTFRDKSVEALAVQNGFIRPQSLKPTGMKYQASSQHTPGKLTLRRSIRPETPAVPGGLSASGTGSESSVIRRSVPSAPIRDASALRISVMKPKERPKQIETKKQTEDKAMDTTPDVDGPSVVTITKEGTTKELKEETHQTLLAEKPNMDGESLAEKKDNANADDEFFSSAPLEPIKPITLKRKRIQTAETLKQEEAVVKQDNLEEEKQAEDKKCVQQNQQTEKAASTVETTNQDKATEPSSGSTTTRVVLRRSGNNQLRMSINIGRPSTAKSVPVSAELLSKAPEEPPKVSASSTGAAVDKRADSSSSTPIESPAPINKLRVSVKVPRPKPVVDTRAEKEVEAKSTSPADGNIPTNASPSEQVGSEGADKKGDTEEEEPEGEREERSARQKRRRKV